MPLAMLLVKPFAMLLVIPLTMPFSIAVFAALVSSIGRKGPKLEVGFVSALLFVAFGWKVPNCLVDCIFCPYHAQGRSTRKGVTAALVDGGKEGPENISSSRCCCHGDGSLG